MIRRCVLSCLGILLIVFVMTKIFQKDENPQAVQAEKSTSTPANMQELEKKEEGFQQKVIEHTPDYQVDLLTPNPYSRPQMALEEIKGIVVHYTANPGTTAAQNRSYFEGLKDMQKTKASSHFVVGIEGEIVQCIPSSEISYASNYRALYRKTAFSSCFSLPSTNAAFLRTFGSESFSRSVNTR